MSSILMRPSAVGTAMADEDQDGDHRPDDFHLGAVDQRGVGLRALRLTELDQRVDHHAEDHHADARRTSRRSSMCRP